MGLHCWICQHDVLRYLRFSQQWLKKFYLLAYNNVQSGESQLMFRKKISPSSGSRGKPCLLPASCWFLTLTMRMEVYVPLKHWLSWDYNVLYHRRYNSSWCSDFRNLMANLTCPEAHTPLSLCVLWTSGSPFSGQSASPENKEVWLLLTIYFI